MATEICNPLIITITYASDSIVADQTYTATRQLRMYDLKLFQLDAAAGNMTVTVSEGANLCITMTDGNSGQSALKRLGQASLTNLLDETNEVVSTGGTIRFTSSEGAGVETRASLYCWTL